MIPRAAIKKALPFQPFRTPQSAFAFSLAMAQDYSKMKNDELQALLKQRSLPHTGKKADMVARLQEDDATKGSSGAPAAASKEDEIDWDDEAGETATTKAAEAAIAAGGQGRVNNPVEVPNQVQAEGPSKTSDLSATVPPKTDVVAPVDETAVEGKDKEDKPAVDFTRGLAETSMEEELAKRAARAKKFGMTDPEADEALKKLERAKKFGEVSGPKGLNEALPERTQGKRSRESGDVGGRGGYKRGGKKFGRGGGRDGGGNRRDGGSRREDVSREVKSSQAGWMSEKDKAAAAARKSRFAAPTAS